MEVQAALVDIWQHHITEYYDDLDPSIEELKAPAAVVHPGDEPTVAAASASVPSAPPPPTSAASSSAVPPPPAAEEQAPRGPVEMERNGHVLRSRPEGGGVFCVKCGKQTYNHQHVRLKITRNRCKFHDLPRDRWLQAPGAHAAQSRLDEQEKALNDKYNKNGHLLVWNRKVGKSPHDPASLGRLWCAKCARSWDWRYRANNLPRSRCQEPRGAITPPDWVTPYLEKYPDVVTFLQERQGVG
uniref:Uncharacterized protein n=1 Tax=Pyrodinium bahamense TaxID=73915 RepID=A0A7S0A5U4_9DINO